MRPANIAHLYRVRLRARLAQELFAVLGIAAGVALLFASQVASQSLQSSVAALSHGITGRATLQVLARDPEGMPQRLLGRVRSIPGVQVAAPLLEASAQASGPRGSSSVQLVGADSSLKQLGGVLVGHTDLEPFAGIGAVLLPAPLAKHVGVTRFGRELTLKLYGKTTQAPLYQQLRASQIGSLVQSPIVVAPLFYAQEMAGLSGRISRILVQPTVGSSTRVRAALTRLTGGRLTVTSTSYDERLFAKAASATNQSTALFAVISALVGFLFAFNAMLLTVPQRRRLIADLRRDGYTPRGVIVIMLLDALVLGVIASALGLVLGEEISIHLFGSNPGYLGSAFAVGTQRVVGWQSIALAAAGGMLAALIAVLSPLRDILSRDPLAALSTGSGSGGSRSTLPVALGGAVALAAAVVLLVADPAAASIGVGLLVAALLALLPAALAAALALLNLLARLRVGAVAHVSGMELQAARGRALGVAATGAIAIFGAVAIQGAHTDLLKGLENAAHDENAFTDLWVTPSGSYNLLRTAPFADDQASVLRRLADVRAVRVYRGGLLDWGERRVWVIAPPRSSEPLVPRTQILQGTASRATAELRSGGWAVLSEALAHEHHLQVGDRLVLPAPTPLTVRVAALSTNIGWAPGAVILNAEDYARGWGAQASAYNVLLDPGASPTRVGLEIRRALGSASGLEVQTSAAHAAEQNQVSRQGLARLTQIATLILAVAVLAMAAAIGSMVWQRRSRLAKLKLEGFSSSVLWRTILLESVLLVGVGTITGALIGLIGQQLLDQALRHVLNYPVVASVVLLPALTSVAIVIVTAVAALALPGLSAVRVPAAVAMEE
jgi:putative ABC transport system permease protein